MSKYIANNWLLKLSPKAYKDLRKLEKQTQQRIADYFDKNILNQLNPRIKGKALAGKLAGHWAYRVGNYRILTEIYDNKMIILAIDIGHRKEVYKQ